MSNSEGEESPFANQSTMRPRHSRRSAAHQGGQVEHLFVRADAIGSVSLVFPPAGLADSGREDQAPPRLPGFELKPMRAVGNPNSDGVNKFPGRYRSCMPDDCDEVRRSARLHLQDGKSIFLIMEGDAFDRAGECFARRSGIRRGLQDAFFLYGEFTSGLSRVPPRQSPSAAMGLLLSSAPRNVRFPRFYREPPA